jgi:hypothetical protein
MSRAVNDLMLQPDAISITRSRLLEVSYFVRVTVGAGSLSSEVSVQLPIRVINFISIDPIPSFAPSQAMLPPKRPTDSIDTEERRSRSMDDVRGIRLARAMFESRVIAPGVGIIASDGTYRGDTTLHPIGRLEVRNFTPPEALVRRQRLQELVFDPGLDADANGESRYLHDRAKMKLAVVDGRERQDDTAELQCVAHAKESQVYGSEDHTSSFGDSSTEDSLERQRDSPEHERRAIPLTAYSSTATQRMYNVSQEASPQRPLPNPSASAYPTSQHPTSRISLSPGDTIDGNFTSDEEASILPDSVNLDDGSNAGALQDSGAEVDREETPDRRPNVHVSFQEEPSKRSPALSRGPFDVLSPIEAISRSTSVSRPWQVGSQPLPTRIRQQSGVSTVASSMQSSRATSMAGGVDSRSSGSYSSYDSVPDPRRGGSKPAQGRGAWGACTSIGRKYPIPNDGRAGTRTSRNIVKGGPGGLVLQPRPLPSSRTAARRSMVEGGLHTNMRTTLGFKLPPPGSVPRPIPQPARSSDNGSANTSPSRELVVSRPKPEGLPGKDDYTEPHPCGKLEFGESSAPQTLHQPTASDDPNFIPPTVSALMRTDIQPGSTSTSNLRGPRPRPERQSSRQLKDEEPLEDISRSAPPFIKKWENTGHLMYLRELDTATSRPHQSSVSTPSRARLGPTSVKSRIAMLEEKTKSLDNTPGTRRWSTTSGISGVRGSVRPLSNSSAVTFEGSISTYRESGRVSDSGREYEETEEGITESTGSDVIEKSPLFKGTRKCALKGPH